MRGGAGPVRGAPLPRLVNVALAVALGLSVVGYAVGIRPARVTEARSAAVSANAAALPGQSYRELRLRRFGPAAQVSSDLSSLHQKLPALTDPVQRDAEARQQALAARAQRRAYDGAPPTVPHPISHTRPGVCLACHEQGLKVREKLAPAIPHPAYKSCTQCHVPEQNPVARPGLSAENSFAGLSAAAPGPRAWPKAPPQIPHTTALRQSCAACHGVTGRPGLRTSHPERRSCRQCHTQAADRRGEGPITW